MFKFHHAGLGQAASASDGDGPNGVVSNANADGSIAFEPALGPATLVLPWAADVSGFATTTAPMPSSTLTVAGTAASSLTVTTSGGGSGFVINASYDSSITSLGTASATYIAVTGAIQAAISFYETHIANNDTITIGFGYGEVNNGTTLAPTALGQSVTSLASESYGALSAALVAHGDSSSSVPASNPAGNWLVPIAEAAVLGLASNATVDGYVGISSTQPFTFDPANRAVTGKYDAIGTFEHEISEVMGRVESLGTYTFPNFYTPMDLFRYSASGTHALSPGAGYFSINGGVTNLATFNNPTGGGDAGDWASSVTNDSYDAFSFSGVTNAVSSTDLTLLNALGYTTTCFVAGTRIAVADGETEVQTLRVGDRVRTAAGALRPIVWIGHGRSLITPRNRCDASPVIFRAGALGTDTAGAAIPRRDLHVTRRHAVLVGDALVPAEHLVNGVSVVWDETARVVEFYHIELETHDLLLAEGAPAESYRDDDSAQLFHNAATRTARAPMPPCRQILNAGPALDRAWRIVAGTEAGVTRDPGLHVLVDGIRVDGTCEDGESWCFDLPRGGRHIAIMSRTTIPATQGEPDQRRLGVAVREIAIWRNGMHRAIDIADPALIDGWHQADAGHRWTKGAALLSDRMDAWLGQPSQLQLRIIPVLSYRAPLARHAA